MFRKLSNVFMRVVLTVSSYLVDTWTRFFPSPGLPLISRQGRHVVAISRSASGNSFEELDDRGITCELGGVEVMGVHVTCWK